MKTKLRFENLDIADLSDADYKKLLKLTYNPKDGYMRMYLELCRTAWLTYKKDDFTCDVYICFKGRSIVGWAIAQDLLYKDGDFLEFSIFVSSRSRGMGVGSSLLETVAEYVDYAHVDKQISVWVHNETSKNLFKKVKDNPNFVCFDSNKWSEGNKRVKYEFNEN
jgi:GNAT superfamily N-acetyltransferase